MDTNTTTALQQAFELLKAGKRAEAHAILVPMVKRNPDVAQAWYLLGFTLTDSDKRLYCFQQVLRIDPAHQAAQKQLARLTEAQRVVPEGGAFTAGPFSSTAPVPAATSEPVSYPIPPRDTAGAPVLPAPALHRTQDGVPQVQVSASSTGTMSKGMTSTDQPRSKTRLILLIGIALVVVVLIAGVGATWLYVSNGMKLDQEVDALFGQRKCEEVVQHASFGESFPKAVFSSFFGVYHQVEECQAKLALDQVLKEQDWPAAYNVIQDYLVVHPSGAFAAEMSEQAGTVLFSWSKNLLAQNDYKTAIEKLKLIQRGFASSSAAQTAVKTMFDDYLLWGKYLYEQKDYQGAEQTLKSVASDGQVSPEQAQQANEGLAAVYLQWGKTQVESGEFDKGLQLYEEARKLNPNLTNYDRLKDQIVLLRVDALVKEADFDGALAMTQTMSDAALSDESKAEADAEKTKILDAYAHSDSEQAKAQMNSATINMCNNKEAPTTMMPLFAGDAETIRFAMVGPFTNLQLPDEWLAKTPAELHYVVCIVQTLSRLETCPYQGGYTLRRNRVAWTVTLYDILTGKATKTTKLQGGEPRECARVEYSSIGALSNDINGDIPSIQKVVDWLITLKLVQ